MTKQFKIGDVVRLVENYMEFKAGTVGKIVRTDKDPNPKSVLYYVETKEGFIEGIYGRRLELVSSETIAKPHAKSKFKIGDKVRANRYSDEHYTITNFSSGWTGTVVDVGKFGWTDENRGDIKVKGTDGKIYSVYSKYFDLIESPTSSELHITVNGNETIAVYKHDGKTEKAVAKCSPEDKFDFKVGAKIALERLGVLPTTEETPMEILFVHNNVSVGICGTPTKYTDAHGTPLFVGDVVEHFADNASYGDTVICDDGEPFVIGIKSKCNNKTGEIKDWTIIKKKSFSDMKHGDIVLGGRIKYV